MVEVCRQPVGNIDTCRCDTGQGLAQRQLRGGCRVSRNRVGIGHCAKSLQAQKPVAYRAGHINRLARARARPAQEIWLTANAMHANRYEGRGRAHRIAAPQVDIICVESGSKRFGKFGEKTLVPIRANAPCQQTARWCRAHGG